MAARPSSPGALPSRCRRARRTCPCGRGRTAWRTARSRTCPRNGRRSWVQVPPPSTSGGRPVPTWRHTCWTSPPPTAARRGPDRVRADVEAADDTTCSAKPEARSWSRRLCHPTTPDEYRSVRTDTRQACPSLRNARGGLPASRREDRDEVRGSLGRRRSGHSRYSVLEKATIAAPRSTVAMTATMPSSSGTGRRQPFQLTPGSSARSAAGDTFRWLKTASRSGSTA